MPAVRADVIRGGERADHELPRLDVADLAADHDHCPAILVAHVHRRGDGVGAAVGPEVGAADAGRSEPDDDVGRLQDLWLRNVFVADVAGAVENGG